QSSFDELQKWFKQQYPNYNVLKSKITSNKFPGGDPEGIKVLQAIKDSFAAHNLKEGSVGNWTVAMKSIISISLVTDRIHPDLKNLTVSQVSCLVEDLSTKYQFFSLLIEFYKSRGVSEECYSYITSILSTCTSPEDENTVLLEIISPH